jgi:hypothetical protein
LGFIITDVQAGPLASGRRVTLIRQQLLVPGSVIGSMPGLARCEGRQAVCRCAMAANQWSLMMASEAVLYQGEPPESSLLDHARPLTNPGHNQHEARLRLLVRLRISCRMGSHDQSS